MVNGVNGVGTNGLSAAELKEFVQDLIEETLATKEAEKASGTEVSTDSTDEESGIVAEEETTQETTTAETDKVENPLTGILTSITSMFETLMNALLEVIGTKNNATDATDDTTATEGETAGADTGNDKYVMTEDEKAYLTLHPDYVKDLIAEEKYQEQYGDKKGIIANVLKNSRMERLTNSVTDAEVQAYLQLHPNVIKDAIASGK